eukprot:scaffold99559_cov65-Phaeocystis_antarctica.AAC.2
MASSLLDFIVRTQLNSAVVIRQPYLAASSNSTRAVGGGYHNERISRSDAHSRWEALDHTHSTVLPFECGDNHCMYYFCSSPPPPLVFRQGPHFRCSG